MQTLYLNYSGTATIHAQKSPKPKTKKQDISLDDDKKSLQDGNLKRGNSIIAGRWGKSAKTRFISRCTWLIENGKKPCYTMILTYRKQPTNKDTKSHINRFILEMKRKQNLEGFAYTLEKTEEGIYHYHFLVCADFFKNDKCSKGGEKASRLWGQIRGDHARNAVRGLNVVRSKFAAGEYFSKAVHYAAKLSKANQDLQQAMNGLDLDAQEAFKKKYSFDPNIRLWATSQYLVKVEKVKIENIEEEGIVNLILDKASSIQDFETDDGYKFTVLFFNRKNTQEIYRLSKEIHKKKQREFEEMLDERQRNKDLMATRSNVKKHHILQSS
jgi:hypothetical protein